MNLGLFTLFAGQRHGLFGDTLRVPFIETA